MAEADWIWMPHIVVIVGISACSDSPHMSYANGFIVSTIREMIDSEVRYDHKYETMGLKLCENGVKMRTTEKPSTTESEHLDKIKQAFTVDELVSVCTTLLGTSALLTENLLKRTTVDECTEQERYAMCQTAAFMKLIDEIIRGEDVIKVVCRFLPFGNKDAWKTDDDFKKRLCIVIKTLYEELKAEGKIV